MRNKAENGHKTLYPTPGEESMVTRSIGWDIFRISGLLALMQEQVLIISFFVLNFRAVDFLSSPWLQILVYFNIHVITPASAACVYDVFFLQRKSYVDCQELRWHNSHESTLLYPAEQSCDSWHLEASSLSTHVNIRRLYKPVSYLESREYSSTLHGTKTRWHFIYY
jgi:hypothetical protein